MLYVSEILIYNLLLLIMFLNLFALYCDVLV